MAYQPIESYGLIGDMRTAALVGTSGSIDWLCFPHFDSPSVFAAILDDDKGGAFVIAPTDARVSDQAAVLSRQQRPGDPVPRRFRGGRDRRLHAGRSSRRAIRTAMRDPPRAGHPWLVSCEMRCAPAFDFSRAPHQVEAAEGGIWFKSPLLDLALGSDSAGPDRRRPPQSPTSAWTRGRRRPSCLANPIRTAPTCVVRPRLQLDLLTATVDYWHQWLSKCTYRGRWREVVHRSALALKLLTFEPTGAIVAAPTCSLPEEVGGSRNWDYRYTWVRDAAFTIYALLRIGFTEEAVPS